MGGVNWQPASPITPFRLSFSTCLSSPPTDPAPMPEAIITTTLPLIRRSRPAASWKRWLLEGRDSPGLRSNYLPREEKLFCLVCCLKPFFCSCWPEVPRSSQRIVGGGRFPASAHSIAFWTISIPTQCTLTGSGSPEDVPVHFLFWLVEFEDVLLETGPLSFNSTESALCLPMLHCPDTTFHINQGAVLHK